MPDPIHHDGITTYNVINTFDRLIQPACEWEITPLPGIAKASDVDLFLSRLKPR